MHLNLFDYLTIIIVVLSTIVSFFRGFLKEIIALIMLLVAILVSVRFFQSAAVFYQGYIHSRVICQIAGFATVFVPVWLVGVLVRWLVGKVVSRPGLRPFDRLLGVFFGCVRGVLVVVLLVLVLSLDGVPVKLLKGSTFAPYFKPAAHWILTKVPTQGDKLKRWMHAG